MKQPRRNGIKHEHEAVGLNTRRSREIRGRDRTLPSIDEFT